MKTQDDHDGIFGSPKEPLFNLVPHGMKPELLEEWLVVMAEQNTAAMEEAALKQGRFKTGRYSEFVFMTSERLGLPDEAKYLAIELFDKFMENHIALLHEHVNTSEKSRKDMKKDWEAIMERVKNQIFLRVVSCCQLASKLTSHYKIVTPRRAQNTLRDFGHKYSLESVTQSELRIIKTLNYKVMLNSPLLYIETILEVLGHNDKTCTVKIYHGSCLKVLDHLYLNWADIYARLFETATKTMTPAPKHKSRFASVQRDFMLTAVVVIASASYTLDANKTNHVIEQLHGITRIPLDDIFDFTNVIVVSILKKQKSKKTAHKDKL